MCFVTWWLSMLEVAIISWINCGNKEMCLSATIIYSNRLWHAHNAWLILSGPMSANKISPTLLDYKTAQTSLAILLFSYQQGISAYSTATNWLFVCFECFLLFYVNTTHFWTRKFTNQAPNLAPTIPLYHGQSQWDHFPPFCDVNITCICIFYAFSAATFADLIIARMSRCTDVPIKVVIESISIHPSIHYLFC